MSGGYIKLYRQSIDSSVWQSPVVWMVWCWCLIKANHETNRFSFNGDDITISPGQFITGREKAVQEIRHVSTQQYRTAMSYLEKTERLTIKTTNKFSLVTIKKWIDYQTNNQPTTNQQPTSNQPVTTNKKDKNVKNDKNKNTTVIKFESFWSAYPRKAGKKTALQKWTKVNPDDELTDRIIAHVESMKQTSQWLRDNGEYIPHPATFLNQERWNDDVPTNQTQVVIETAEKPIEVG